MPALDIGRLSNHAQGLLKAAYRAGRLPGACIWVANAGEPSFFIFHGFSLLYEDASRFADVPVRLRPDTLFDLASLTKLYTALGAALLIAQGKLRLEDTLDQAFGVYTGLEPVRLAHLLSHTAGLAPWVPLFQNPTHVANPWPYLASFRNGPPGKEACYSDLGYMLLGRWVELASGTPLDQFLAKAVLKPLGLGAACFNPKFSQRPRIAASEWQADPPRGMVWGSVHDENAYALGGVAGHAGLFATADDVGRFALRLMELRSGPLFLAREILWRSSRISRELSVSSLGFEKDKAFYMGKFADVGAFGHTGFTGTSLVIVPNDGLCIVFLSNRVHPSRNRGKINDLREALANLVFESLR